MINFLKKLPDWIYKKKCYICGSSKENKKVCSFCLEKIPFLAFKEVYQFSNIRIYSASLYEKNIQKLIRGIKYHKQKELDYYLAKVLFKYWKSLNTNDDEYIIIPVPMFKEKIKQRKYNHMNLIANEFSRLMNYELNLTSLERTKDTKPQYKLTKKQREKNLKDAFTLNPEALKSKKILLLDDITTTGSTLNEIIKEFQKHEITDITALTIASPNFQ